VNHRPRHRKAVRQQISNKFLPLFIYYYFTIVGNSNFFSKIFADTRLIEHMKEKFVTRMAKSAVIYYRDPYHTSIRMVIIIHV
jgi:hypothetical protein